MADKIVAFQLALRTTLGTIWVSAALTHSIKCWFLCAVLKSQDKPFYHHQVGFKRPDMTRKEQ